MAENSIDKILIGFALFGLMVWLILSYAGGLASNYGTSVEEMSGGALNASQYYQGIEGLEQSAQTYRDRFESGEINDVDDATGIFSVLKDMVNMILAPYRLLTQTLSNVLHVPDIAIDIILGLSLTIAIIGLIWRKLKLGY